MISHQVKHSDDLFVYEYDLSKDLDFESLAQDAYKVKDELSAHKIKHHLMHNLFMSGYLTHHQTSIFSELISIVEKKTNEKSNIVLSNVAVKAKFKLLESWLVIYDKYGYVENHNHFPFGYSFVCYISAKNTSSICFHDIEISPSTGKFLLFPGVLSHRIKPVLPSHGERIVFAGNLYPTFDYSFFENLADVENCSK